MSPTSHLSAAAKAAPVVRYFLDAREVFPDGEDADLNRKIRKMFATEARKQSKRYGKIVHPETGERPEIHLRVPKAKTIVLNVVLAAGTEQMRDYMASLGMVVNDAGFDASLVEAGQEGDRP